MLSVETTAMIPILAQAVKELGASVIVWNEAVTPEDIRAANDNGLRVWVYTIDDPEKARALVALGATRTDTNHADADGVEAAMSDPDGNDLMLHNRYKARG